MSATFFHVCYNVRDMNKMVDFYVNGLGYEKVKDSVIENNAPVEKAFGLEKGSKYHFVKIDIPRTNMWIKLIQWIEPKVEIPEKPVSPITAGLNCVVYDCEDLESTMKTLKEKFKTEFFSEPVESTHAGVKFVFARDPEGNIIEFSQPDKK